MAAAEPKQSVDVVPEQTITVGSPSGAQGASTEDWPQPVLAAKDSSTPKKAIIGFAMAPTVYKRESKLHTLRPS